jgi:lipoyl(octanoyl) transferase
MHGFAFNVNTDLSLFDGIIPCGIKEKSVTSLQNELGRAIEINEVKSIILKNFTEVFDYSPAGKKDLDEFLISEIIDQ